MSKPVNLALTAILFLIGFVSIYSSDTMRVTTRPSADLVASYTTPKREIAFSYAKKQEGDWYSYGGNGPRTWDCSGLVAKSYKVAGIDLPRTSSAQRSSSATYHVSRYRAKRGNLVFWGYGHVELLDKIYKSNGTWYTRTFGAHHSGTRVSYRTSAGVPHIEAVRGAG